MSEAPTGDDVDLFVIGGGVNGVGIARDAAGRGLSVTLVEQDDLASATSSASSKLIHGGLRYLAQYAFRLVRESLAEREVLLGIAPHLVHPLRFVMPLHGGGRPAWMLRLGLLLYDRLGGWRTSLPPSRSHNLRGAALGAGLTPAIARGFSYSDCRVDDARLVIASARDAADRGARILTRTECMAARRDGARWIVTIADRATGGLSDLRARVLVNAAGPWAGRVATAVAGVMPRQYLRLVKGSHLVVPRLYEGDHAYILQNHDGRIVFVIPFQDAFSIVGTTDVPHDGPPGPVGITPAEIAYLRDCVARYFARPFEADEIVWSWAGIRPLYDDGKADPSAVTRDYVLEIDGDSGTAPLLSVFGGKITTYRRLAEHAMALLAPSFPGLRPAWTGREPLSGGRLGADGTRGLVEHSLAAYAALPPALVRALVGRHGADIAAVLGDARTPADLGADFGGGLFAREVAYFMRREWARTAEDVIWRRSKAGLSLSEQAVAALSRWMAEQSRASAEGALADRR